MKIEINEVIIDGIKWNLEYGDDLNNGFRLWKPGAGSAHWALMKAKSNSPLKGQRKEAEEWFAEQRQLSRKRLHLVSKLIEVAETVSADDIILKSEEEE
jgi:hypothetical protein